MAFELKGRNTIVRGEFNRAIIGPKWLVDQRVSPDDKVELAVSDSADMPRLFRFAGFHWTVAHDRLVVQSVSPQDDDPAPKIAEVLRILKHTPVSGTGHNFLFESTEPEPCLETHLGDWSAARIGEELGHELRKSTYEVRLSTGEHQSLTVKIVTDLAKQSVDLNFHFDTPDAQAAANAADESASCRERADEVLKTLTRNPT